MAEIDELAFTKRLIEEDKKPTIAEDIHAKPDRIDEERVLNIRDFDDIEPLLRSNFHFNEQYESLKRREIEVDNYKFYLGEVNLLLTEHRRMSEEFFGFAMDKKESYDKLKSSLNLMAHSPRKAQFDAIDDIYYHMMLAYLEETKMLMVFEVIYDKFLEVTKAHFASLFKQMELDDCDRKFNTVVSMMFDMYAQKGIDPKKLKEKMEMLYERNVDAEAMLIDRTIEPETMKIIKTMLRAISVLDTLNKAGTYPPKSLMIEMVSGNQNIVQIAINNCEKMGIFKNRSKTAEWREYELVQNLTLNDLIKRKKEITFETKNIRGGFTTTVNSENKVQHTTMVNSSEEQNTKP
jgi:hypothetical protein